MFTQRIVIFRKKYKIICDPLITSTVPDRSHTATEPPVFRLVAASMTPWAICMQKHRTTFNKHIFEAIANMDT